MHISPQFYKTICIYNYVLGPRTLRKVMYLTITAKGGKREQNCIGIRKLHCINEVTQIHRTIGREPEIVNNKVDETNPGNIYLLSFSHFLKNTKII